MRFLILLLPLFTLANECLTCHKIDLKIHAPMHYSLNKEISLTLKAWGLREYNYTLQSLPQSGKELKAKSLKCKAKSQEPRVLLGEKGNRGKGVKGEELRAKSQEPRAIERGVKEKRSKGVKSRGNSVEDLGFRVKIKEQNGTKKLFLAKDSNLHKSKHLARTSSSFQKNKGVKEERSKGVKSLDKNSKLNTTHLALKINLAFDFLRRKCLQCHLTSKRVNPSNNACLACHSPHFNKFDAFKAKATQDKCLKCHNGNFIGTDYLGLFPKDFDESYRSPIQSDGSYPKRLGGIDYHHLIKDIHAKKGLTCISCHNNKQGNFEKAYCISCHQNISTKNHPKHHSKISCIVCHSAWQTNSYKSIILRSDTKNYKDFQRLTLCEDPYLEKFLKKALQNQNIAPQMPDFLTNKMHKGLWYLGYEFRRWENFYLINYKGKIELARPLLDFELTYINDKNKTLIDAKKFGGFVVTKPHTIIKEAKSCESCHANKLNLNDKSLINYNTLKGKLIEGEPLNKEQIERLISKKYKFLRAKELFSE